jgi:hypothetical protein
VVQRYIDRSLPMMLANADATAIRKPDTFLHPKPHALKKDACADNTRSSSSSSSAAPAPMYNINVTITGDVSGSLGLFQKD